VKQMFLDIMRQTIAAFHVGTRFTTDAAIQTVDEWLAHPNIRLLTHGENHWPGCRQMMVRPVDR
jgi:hypothetical protein